MKPADIALLHTLGKPTIAPDGEAAVVAMIRRDLDADDYRRLQQAARRRCDRKGDVHTTSGDTGLRVAMPR